MILAFSKSRRIAWIGSAVLSTAAVAVWISGAGGPDSLSNRIFTAFLIAFIAVSIAIYAARILAEREYRQRLLLLYEKLDPESFLRELLPLKEARLDPSSRCTALVHLSNGYLYSGQPLQALEVLDSVQPPERALELRGLVAGNRATCLLAAGETGGAQAAMDELRRIAAAKGCKKEFAIKARHTLGYLQLCMDIACGKQADLRALERDFESSRSPLHRLDVQYRMALEFSRKGDQEGVERACAYLVQNSGATCYRELAGML